jgi:hypothetical protein
MKLSRLTLRGMLETAIGDGAKKLGLQQEVTETSRVDTDVRTLLVDIVAGSGSFGLLSVRGRGGGLVVELVVRVVDEILLSRHVGGCWGSSRKKGQGREQGWGSPRAVGDLMRREGICTGQGKWKESDFLRVEISKMRKLDVVRGGALRNEEHEKSKKVEEIKLIGGLEARRR